MIVRSLDPDQDWLFGRGKNDYLKDRDAVTQNIATRLRSFLGDCFFDKSAGLDWFVLLGGKSQDAINLAVKTAILNTAQVKSLVEVSLHLNSARNLTLTYTVDTVLPGRIGATVGLLLTEDGDVLITEDGDSLHA